MQKVPIISNQLDKEKFFEIINENFSSLAPAYYTLITNWLIDAGANELKFSLIISKNFSLSN